MLVKTDSKTFLRDTACAALALVLGFLLLARGGFGYHFLDRSGWKTEESGICRYLDRSGNALLGWHEIEGSTYYFSPEQEGAMVTGWLEDGSGRYYFDDLGVMQTGWQELPEGQYFFSEEGLMQIGWMETPQGCCYLTETGAITGGWVDAEDGRYYITEDGALYTGWLELDGRRYYFSETGVLHTGWLEVDGNRYFCKEDGAAAVGQLEVDGETHHFASDGKLFLLVNRWNPVPADYEPNLVPFGTFQVDASCLEDLTAMVEACQAAGFPCTLTSAYRGVDYQTTLFQTKVNKLMAAGYTRAAAEAETARSIAIPGTSEHHLGLAVDIKNGYNTYGWLAQNSWKYGFHLRYPDGTTALTGIYYEPWHYRYVGKDLAKELYDLGICMEAYVAQLTESSK